MVFTRTWEYWLLVGWKIFIPFMIVMLCLRGCIWRHSAHRVMVFNATFNNIDIQFINVKCKRWRIYLCSHIYDIAILILIFQGVYSRVCIIQYMICHTICQSSFQTPSHFHVTRWSHKPHGNALCSFPLEQVFCSKFPASNSRSKVSCNIFVDFNW